MTMPQTMKALSLTQPYASALFIRLADGSRLKTIETRSWRTNYTGRIAIHAAKGFPKWAREFAETERAVGRIPARLPFGAIIGFVTIMGMRMTEDLAPQITALERLYGDYSPGRWGWMTCDAEPLPDDKIIPCKGSLGLWNVPPEIDLSGGGAPRETLPLLSGIEQAGEAAGQGNCQGCFWYFGPNVQGVKWQIPGEEGVCTRPGGICDVKATTLAESGDPGDRRKCRVCGCTDDDCRQCIEKTGEPCSWVAEDLCSACAPEDDDQEELCPECGSSMIWQECDNCEDGFAGHDCGDDCCCCADPEDNVVCDICRGNGGWLVCLNRQNHGVNRGD